MKLRSVLYWFLLTELFGSMLFAQLFGDAPEVWSFPEPIKKLGSWPLQQRSVFVVPSNDTLYFSYGNIYCSIRSDSGWLEPIKLNDNINGSGLAQNPSLSPDGKTLYFSDWRNGEWDFWYSDWDDSTNDWGEARNLGSPINNWEYEWVCHQVDETHFYFHQGGLYPMLSVWDNTAGWWGQPHRLDTLHHLSVDNGISVPRNMRKVYTGDFTSTQQSDDLYVSYLDTTSGWWSFPKRLNISRMMDSAYSEPGERYQAFPSVTPDGRLIYFIGGNAEIMVSRLLSDENGNPVSVKEPEPSRPEGYQLEQNYPNPFNPLTHFRFHILNTSRVSLKVFDVLGRGVATLIDGEVRLPGAHTVIWDGAEFPSGLYLYRFSADIDFIETRKMILIR